MTIKIAITIVIILITRKTLVNPKRIVTRETPTM
jgi:hypothetical protein